MQKSTSLARCNSSLVSLNNELTVRTCKLADRVERLLSVKIDLQERAQTLILKNEEYKSEVAGLHTMNESLTSRNRLLSDSNMSLHSKVEELSDEVHNKTLEIETTRSTLRQTEKDLSDTRRQSARKDAELKMKSDELKYWSERYEAVERENAEKTQALMVVNQELFEKKRNWQQYRRLPLQWLKNYSTQKLLHQHSTIESVCWNTPSPKLQLPFEALKSRIQCSSNVSRISDHLALISRRVSKILHSKKRPPSKFTFLLV
eukprot:TRINITY_DN61_c0_g1_i1.p1 TRINITY_DN61_c0_g1~~TRINITY_DN61_c0_g1_i1.p1  ORF type:complete len:261 (-),score=40.35 TRINITY_DN61_c0_g1_i1:445-1227(-)